MSIYWAKNIYNFELNYNYHIYTTLLFSLISVSLFILTFLTGGYNNFKLLSAILLSLFSLLLISDKDLFLLLLLVIIKTENKNMNINI